MPIPKADFGTLPAPAGRGTTVGRKIVEFLARNPGMAYSTSEIIEALGVKRQTANQTLKKLAEDEKVSRGEDAKGNVYNMITDKALAELEVGAESEEE